MWFYVLQVNLKKLYWIFPVVKQKSGEDTWGDNRWDNFQNCSVQGSGDWNTQALGTTGGRDPCRPVLHFSDILRAAFFQPISCHQKGYSKFLNKKKLLVLCWWNWHLQTIQLMADDDSFVKTEKTNGKKHINRIILSLSKDLSTLFKDLFLKLLEQNYERAFVSRLLKLKTVKQTLWRHKY